MTLITIPKKHHIGLAKFFDLSDPAFDQLISTLDKSDFDLDFKSPLINATSSIASPNEADTTAMVEALMSLYIARASSDKSTTDFINEFPKAIADSKSEELMRAGESAERVRSRLTRLLGLNSLALAAKARSVLLEYEHTFYSARVLTDIRPVFGENPEEAKALMIVHNLKVHYHGSEDHKNFFVALDSKDIQKLIDILERAKAKAEALKLVLSKSNLPYIEPE